METSDKNYKISFTIIFIVIAISLISLAAFGLSESKEITSNSGNRIEQYKKEIHNTKLQQCQLDLRYNYIKCLNEARASLRSEERDERDLAAQETMAVWTFVMSTTAIIGLICSIIGIALVWQTFQETRKSNDIARVQVTAYPAIDITFELGARKEDNYMPIIRIDVRNPGATPVLDLFAVSRLSLLLDGKVVMRKSYTGNQERGLIRVDPSQSEAVFVAPDDASFSPYISEMAANRTIVKIDARLTHTDVFGKKTTTRHFYKSAKIYHYPNMGEPGGEVLFNIKMQRYLPVSPDDF